MNESIWAVIPAAGIGTRMQTERPKQYLSLSDKTVIEHAISCFSQRYDIAGIVVGINPHDKHWPDIAKTFSASKAPNKYTRPKDATKKKQLPNIISCIGGRERCDTVLNALNKLLQYGAQPDDWVMVHDAARPCLAQSDIDKLIDTVTKRNDKQPICGGILAYAVCDTMKRQITTIPASIETSIDYTEDRDGLWHALTPQMFHLNELHHALETALNNRSTITDEASALEYIGQHPILVEGKQTNIKITHPDDLELAAFFLGR